MEVESPRRPLLTYTERERESGRVAVNQLPGHSPCPYFLNGSLSNCEPIYKLRRGVASRGCRIYVVY